MGISIYPAGVKEQTEEFTSSGTFVVPNGVSVLHVTLVGGGGGGDTTSNAYGGGGGGGGGYVEDVLAVTPGDAYTVTIGAGGTGAVYSSSTAATNGGDTIFTSAGAQPNLNANSLGSAVMPTNGASYVTSITIPTGVNAGEIMILRVVSPSTPTVPSGWTQLAETSMSYYYGSAYAAVFSKTAVAGDPGSAVTLSNSFEATIESWQNVGGSPIAGPWWVSSGTANGSTTILLAAAGMSGVAPNCAFIDSFFGIQGAQSGYTGITSAPGFGSEPPTVTQAVSGYTTSWGFSICGAYQVSFNPGSSLNENIQFSDYIANNTGFGTGGAGILIALPSVKPGKTLLARGGGHGGGLYSIGGGTGLVLYGASGGCGGGSSNPGNGQDGVGGRGFQGGDGGWCEVQSGIVTSAGGGGGAGGDGAYRSPFTQAYEGYPGAGGPGIKGLGGGGGGFSETSTSSGLPITKNAGFATDGGGNGGTSSVAPSAGTPNTGGGGGGGNSSLSPVQNGANGGSGVCIVKWYF